MQKTILLISSDQELIRQITSHIEMRGDFRIYAAETEDDALSTAAGRKVDAVILDEESLEIHLPSFLDDLVDILPDARVIRFSTQSSSETNEDVICLPSQLVLQKPFSQREMNIVLDEIVNVKASPDENEGLPFDEDFSQEDREPADLSDFLSESELNNLNNLLENMPPPDPEAATSTEAEDEIISEGPPPIQPSSAEDWIPITLVGDEVIEGSTSIDVEPLESISDTLPPPLPPLPTSEEVNEEVSEITTSEPPASEGYPPEPEESLPGTAPLGVMSVRFDYYCVLIPNNPDQFLARDISDRLGFILPQLHIANGWRVTSLSIRPLFMMWQVSLPASTSPVEAVNEIRRRTTSHLYTNFTELLKTNDQDDFWAPGYLIMSGSQAPSNSLINDFIKRTRSAQQGSSA